MSSVQRRSRWRFPTLDHAWIVAALGLVALRPLIVPIPPHDFWWHMATGRLIAQTGAIPTTDGFSYTQAGQPFYNQGWLAQLLMYGLHSLGGVPLVLIAQALVIALAYGLLLWLCTWRSGALRLSIVLLLLTLPLSFDNWNVRPQSYVYPIFVAFLVVLTRWRQAPPLQPPANLAGLRARYADYLAGGLWLLPLLMLLWVNMHGSFVLGGALMALTFLGVWGQRSWQRWRGRAAQATGLPVRALFFWGLVTAAVLLVNPRGIGVIGYVLNLLSTSTVTNLVEEWAAPTIRAATGRTFFLFVLLLMGVLAYARRRPDPVDMLLAAPLFWLALGAERNIIWFLLATLPLLAVLVADWFPARPAGRPGAQGVPMINALLIGIVALLLLLGLPWIKPHLGLPPEVGTLVAPNTPQRAVESLQADPHPPQRLFHSMAHGSYLIWAAPTQPVFIDTRIELYPFAQWRDYIRLNAGTDAAALLAHYRIDGLLLDTEEQAGLIAVVRTDPAWDLRYADEYTLYLVRQRQ